MTSLLSSTMIRCGRGLRDARRISRISVERVERWDLRRGDREWRLETTISSSSATTTPPPMSAPP